MSGARPAPASKARPSLVALKKPVGKTKEELALEKKRELERRLQDVSGQLNSAKKPPKKRELEHGRLSVCLSVSGTAAALPPPGCSLL